MGLLLNVFFYPQIVNMFLIALLHANSCFEICILKQIKLCKQNLIKLLLKPQRNSN